MNHPYIQELLANQRLNELRAQGMRSQELRRAGIGGTFALKSNFEPVFRFIASLSSRVRLPALKERWQKAYRTGRSHNIFTTRLMR